MAFFGGKNRVRKDSYRQWLAINLPVERNMLWGEWSTHLVSLHIRVVIKFLVTSFENQFFVGPSFLFHINLVKLYIDIIY